MKKKFLICFIAIMLLSVSACAKNESAEEKDNTVETTVEKTVAETSTTEEQETEETVTAVSYTHLLFENCLITILLCG